MTEFNLTINCNKSRLFNTQQEEAKKSKKIERSETQFSIAKRTQIPIEAKIARNLATKEPTGATLHVLIAMR